MVYGRKSNNKIQGTPYLHESIMHDIIVSLSIPNTKGKTMSH